MKAVMSLENRTILPNIKFKNPNPASMKPSSLTTYVFRIMLTGYSSLQERKASCSCGAGSLANRSGRASEHQLIRHWWLERPCKSVEVI